MAVLDPVKLIITNYPQDKEEILVAENNPEDPSAGTREVPFSREIYIEREDFKESANRKFFRLTLDKEVRLKNAYIIKGESVIKDEAGNITEIHCTYDSESKSGSGTEASQRKVKGTLHWVSAKHAVSAEIRTYDRLFLHPSPDADKEVDFIDHINPNSFDSKLGWIEPSIQDSKAGTHFQFQRLGYYITDPDTQTGKLVFNKTVGLRDSWAKKNNS
jgi:glutaminyl-tRNA synthetase